MTVLYPICVIIRCVIKDCTVFNYLLLVSSADNLYKQCRASKMHLNPQWLRLLSVLSRGSVVVDLLFNVLPVICGSSVFVFVLLCITLCPF